METKQDILKRNIENRQTEILYREINITNYEAMLVELGDTEEDKEHSQRIQNLLDGEKKELRKDLIFLKVNEEQLALLS